VEGSPAGDPHAGIGRPTRPVRAARAPSPLTVGLQGAYHGAVRTVLLSMLIGLAGAIVAPSVAPGQPADPSSAPSSTPSSAPVTARPVPRLVLIGPRAETRKTGVTITFTTRPACFSQVRCWAEPTGAKVQTARTDSASTAHRHVLEGLRPECGHSYQVLLSGDDGVIDEATANFVLTFSTVQKELEAPPGGWKTGDNPDLPPPFLLGPGLPRGQLRPPPGTPMPVVDPAGTCHFQELLGSPTIPGDDGVFHERVQRLLCGLGNLESAGKDVTALKARAIQIRNQYFLNKIKAARRLDDLIREAAAVGTP